MIRQQINTHDELEVYRLAFESAMTIFEITKGFPREETYALTDQIRRSSRSVCGNIAEAWRKRRYSAAFVSKLSDAEGEAAETQTWLKFALKCNYLREAEYTRLNQSYDFIIGKLVRMISAPQNWSITQKTVTEK